MTRRTFFPRLAPISEQPNKKYPDQKDKDEERSSSGKSGANPTFFWFSSRRNGSKTIFRNCKQINVVGVLDTGKILAFEANRPMIYRGVANILHNRSVLPNVFTVSIFLIRRFETDVVSHIADGVCVLRLLSACGAGNKWKESRKGYQVVAHGGRVGEISASM